MSKQNGFSVWGSGRPRPGTTEWTEAESASCMQKFQFALWLMLWHSDANNEFGAALEETRRPGYGGGLIWQ